MGAPSAPESPPPPGSLELSEWGPHCERGAAYHGLLHLHLDNVLVDVVALVLARDAVVDVLPQVMLTAREGSKSGARKGGPSQVYVGTQHKGPCGRNGAQDHHEPLPLDLHLRVHKRGGVPASWGFSVFTPGGVESIASCPACPTSIRTCCDHALTSPPVSECGGLTPPRP